MPSEAFQDAVKREILRLATSARSLPDRGQTAAQPTTQAGAVTYAPSDVVAFVDLENFFFLLKNGYRVAAQAIHLPNLLAAVGKLHGIPITKIHVVCGIRDRQRDPVLHEERRKRVAWLERQGVTVTVLPMHYYPAEDGGEVRVKEKGVDVRLAGEILRAVGQGLQRAIVVTQDLDIAEGVLMASGMAAERGQPFNAYSLRIPEGDELRVLARAQAQSAGGLPHTTPLDLPAGLVRSHVSPPRAVAEAKE